jgi:hypothetical protein
MVYVHVHMYVKQRDSLPRLYQLHVKTNLVHLVFSGTVELQNCCTSKNVKHLENMMITVIFTK